MKIIKADKKCQHCGGSGVCSCSDCVAYRRKRKSYNLQAGACAICLGRGMLANMKTNVVRPAFIKQGRVIGGRSG